MTEETLQAAILQMRSQVLSRLGELKDLARRPTSTNDVAELVNNALQISQLEGAISALQQMAPGLMQAGLDSLVPPPEPPAPSDSEPAELEAEDILSDTDDDGIGHEDLMERSPTYRNSVKRAEAASDSESEG